MRTVLVRGTAPSGPDHRSHWRDPRDLLADTAQASPGGETARTACACQLRQRLSRFPGHTRPDRRDNKAQRPRRGAGPRAARRIGEYLTTHPGTNPVTIQGELAGEDALVVPRETAVLLAQVLGYLANGEGVNVMPDSAELTTQQAAEFLNVSRPFLIKLLESDEIPFRRIGTQRRIRFRDLKLYKSEDDLKHRQAADDSPR